MRIENLHIRNFQRITEINLQPAAPVLLVAGHNEAGKSSLRDAVRMAITGESTRVKLKKDYKAMLRQGSKDGEIAVGLSGGMAAAINLKDWSRQAVGIDDLAENIPYLIDPSEFARLDAKARRTLLFRITKSTFSGKAVAEKMVSRGAPQGKVEEILPFMRSGFPAAADKAKQNATESRGAWKAITGEAYGSQKAEGWAMQAEDIDPSELAHKQNQHEEAECELKEKQATLSYMMGQRKNALSEEEINRLNVLVKNEPSVIKAADAVNSQIADLDKNAPSRPGEKKSPLSCPHCEGHVVIVSGCLMPFDEQSTDDANGWEAYQNTREALLKDLKLANDKLEEIRIAKTRLDDFNLQREKIPSEEDVSIQEAAVKGASERLEKARKELQEAEAKADKFIEASAKTDQAYQYHQDAKEWSDIEGMLSLNGIQAEILEGAMAPFHAATGAVSEATGWPLVTIDNEMEIRIGGRPYGLGSESAQWRADITIAYAIAALSEIRFICADRVDVLDIPNRGKFMKWIHASVQSGEIEGALLLGTFKEPPGLPASTFDVVWLENGEAFIKEDDKAVA